MVRRINAGLPAALRLWRRTDPALARAARSTRPYEARQPSRSAFEALAQSVLNQQVSLAAGRTIVGRLRDACGGRIAPGPVLRLGGARLRAAGVSRQKQGYLLDLARRARDGQLDGRRLARGSDEAAIEALTAVKGIGDWTAKMFLIFHLQRPDVVAPEDLGLQHGARLVYGVPRARAQQFLERRSELWRPYRSLACLTLWAVKDGARRPTAPGA